MKLIFIEADCWNHLFFFKVIGTTYSRKRKKEAAFTERKQLLLRLSFWNYLYINRSTLIMHVKTHDLNRSEYHFYSGKFSILFKIKFKHKNLFREFQYEMYPDNLSYLLFRVEEMRQILRVLLMLLMCQVSCYPICFLQTFKSSINWFSSVLYFLFNVTINCS